MTPIGRQQRRDAVGSTGKRSPVWHGLMSDLGVEFSVRSACRDRIRAEGMEETVRSTLLDPCRERGVAKTRGKQRTASTHRDTRLEGVGETLRAALASLAILLS